MNPPPHHPYIRTPLVKTVSTKLVSCLGERLNDNELDSVLTDCMDPEDDEGFIPYIREYPFSYFKSTRSFHFKSKSCHSHLLTEL